MENPKPRYIRDRVERLFENDMDMLPRFELPTLTKHFGIALSAKYVEKNKKYFDFHNYAVGTKKENEYRVSMDINFPLRIRFGLGFDPDNNRINEYIIGMGRTFGNCTTYDSDQTIMLTETIHIDDDNKKYYVTNLKYTWSFMFDIIIGGEYFYYPKDYFGPIDIDSTFGYYVVTDEKRLNKKRFGGEIGFGITPFYKRYLSFDMFIKVDEKGKIYDTGGIITVRWGFDHSEVVERINKQY